MRQLLLIPLCFFVIIVASAQTRSLNGSVVDASSGVAIAGASVVAGANGVQTNDEGRFSIDIPANVKTLKVSFVGFADQTVAIGNSDFVNISLQPAGGDLDQVVVVGYGTQRKRNVTGAVSSVSASRIKDIGVSNFENAILGQVPGVQVSEPSGEPGSGTTIRVRGVGSISAGNEPLYVIDGFPVSKNVEPGIQGEPRTRTVAFRPPTVNPLSTISPGDIESIEILKDASAAAIYGSRASNGVVIVTTKRGNRSGGKAVVSYDGFVGVQNVARKVELMNAAQLTAYVKEARNNAYLQDVPGATVADNNVTRTSKVGGVPGLVVGNYIIPDDFENPDGTDTDWQDLIFKSALIQNHTVALSGGTEKLGYYISGNYYDQEGVIDRTGFKRYSTRISIDAQPYKRLRIGVNLNGSYTYNRRGSTSAPYFADPPGAVYAALVSSPTVKPYLPDGSINQSDNQSHLFTSTGASANMTASSNPLAVIAYINNNLSQYRTIAGGFAEYDILPGLKYKLYAGTDINVYDNNFYREKAFLDRTQVVGVPLGQSNSSFGANWLVENTLNYSRQFGDHSLAALVGYSAQKDRIKAAQVQAENYPDDLVETVSGGLVTGGTSTIEEWALVSQLARINYDFKDKYLLTASIRADNASRFGKGNRTGVFPSVSAGWRIIDEAFLQDVGFLSDLKLRASWGKTGNFLIPNYASIGLLNPANYVFGGNVVSGIAPSTPSNRALTWEKNTQTDIGLEIGFFNNRIFANIDWYRKITSDLLLNVQVPAAVGFGTANPLQNIGKVSNTGFEFGLSTRNLTGRFTWNTDLNFSTNKNKVLELGITGDPVFGASAHDTRHITRIGDPIGSYFGYVVEGIYQTQDEIDRAPTDQLAIKTVPGDFKFKDVNGDGVVNAQDRTVLGSYFPDFTYGITNRFAYKGFELNFLIQGVEGAKVLNLTRRHLANGEALTNSYALFLDRWVSPEQPGNGKVPRADKQTTVHNNNTRPSSFQVEDASYIRLRNLTLGYRFSEGQISRGFPALRVYLSGTNLLTFTDYVGYNPEVNNQSTNNNTPGEDYGAYPLTRNFTIGVNVSF